MRAHPLLAYTDRCGPAQPRVLTRSSAPVAPVSAKNEKRHETSARLSSRGDFHAAYVERTRRMSENKSESENETLTLFLQIFEGIEIITEQIELLESAFGQESKEAACARE